MMLIVFRVHIESLTAAASPQGNSRQERDRPVSPSPCHSVSSQKAALMDRLPGGTFKGDRSLFPQCVLT